MVTSRATAARSIATFTRSYPSFQSTSSAASRPAFFQQSFHPTLAASLAAESSASSQKKWNVLAAAVLAGFVSAYTLISADSLKLDAAPSSASGLPSLAAESSKQVVVDSDTGLSFPLYLSTPASLKSTSNQSEQPRFRLVGLGVRTVSFLRVKVYVAALYIDEAKLQSRLSQSSNSDKTLEQNIKEMLDDATSAIIRIVPVRNTDFNHLRDGFIRALQNRLKKAIKNAQIPSDSPLEQQFQQAIGQIKESFPRGSVPKGSPLDLVILPTDAGKPARMGLNFEYDGQIFGQVQTGAAPAGVAGDNGVDAGFTVARELVLAYFADQGEISTPFKKSVQDALFQQLPSSA
ncbi:uncharacterized protein UTRI_03670_B [Ustilago trichophora]|uniref:Chalcone isomerase domain-containing protein n=1 Tax=Ustilago trichophora TaxID=86804 RepID=A0A5C3E2X0_9BASI|nr:uncharacterized protein UTRI_03670_B [Ustilago trichophora]